MDTRACVEKLLAALDTLTGDLDTLEKVRDMVAGFLPAASKKARRVRIAARMLRAGAKRRDAAFALQKRFGISRKTSYRDLHAALCQNRPPSDTTQA